MGVYRLNIAREWVENGHSNEVYIRNSLQKLVYGRRRDEMMLSICFFVLVLVSLVTKSSRRLSRDSSVEKPRRLCDQLKLSIAQIFTHFLEFLKNCPKMFPFLCKMIGICLRIQKNKILGGGVFGRNIALWQNLLVRIGQFVQNCRARVACALQPICSILGAIFVTSRCVDCCANEEFLTFSELPQGD